MIIALINGIPLLTCNQDKPKEQFYRIERFTYKNGKNTGGRMEDNGRKIECVGSEGCLAYTFKYDSILAGNEGYDSVIFVIVKQ